MGAVELVAGAVVAGAGAVVSGAVVAGAGAVVLVSGAVVSGAVVAGAGAVVLVAGAVVVVGASAPEAPEARAVDIGPAAAVMAVCGDLSPVTTASLQPAAIPITREAPTMAWISLRPSRSIRMATPTCAHPWLVLGRSLATIRRRMRQFGLVNLDLSSPWGGLHLPESPVSAECCGRDLLFAFPP